MDDEVNPHTLSLYLQRRYDVLLKFFNIYPPVDQIIFVRVKEFLDFLINVPNDIVGIL